MNILFLGIDFDGLHGSFLHILEYAQYFRQRGDEVYAASIFISSRNKKFLEDDSIHVFHIKDLPLDIEYDVVYALHLILFPYLLAKGLKYNKVIYMSLSSQVPIESLPPSILWPQFDLMGVISEEIRNHFVKEFSINPNYISVIPNHIPLNYLEMSNSKQNWNKSIKKICVISNHFNPEVSELKDIAPFEIDYYGSSYHNPVKVSPELLLKYDVILTIGKTVQYGLGLGIPVFQYDLFGGCGYITLENIQSEEKTNFSGRGTRRKLSPTDILQEMILNYPLACAQAPGLRRLALQKYSINSLINHQLNCINSKNIPKPKLSNDAILYCNTCLAAINYMYRAFISDKCFILKET